MKKLVLLAALFICACAQSQTYVSGSFSLYDGGSTFSQRAMPTVEIGTIVNDVFSIGLATGRTSFASSGKYYSEIRPTLTVFSQKSFSLSGTLGVGKVWDAEQDFLTEYCGNLGYSIDKNWGISVFGGGYHFNGRVSSSKSTFVGTSLTYIFKR